MAFIYWLIFTWLFTTVVFWVVDEIQKFIEEVNSLGYKEKPRYEKLACILKNGLKTIQAKDDGKLDFTPPSGALSAPVKVHIHMRTYMVSHCTQPRSFCFGGCLCNYIGEEC